MTTTVGPENPAFVGFIAVSERPKPTESYYSCPSEYRFAASASFNGCCPSLASADCPIATTCVDGTLRFSGSTSACQQGSCQSQFLVPATEGPTTTAYFCGGELKFGKTLYRADPASTASASSGSTGSILASSTSNFTSAATSISSTYGPAPGTPPPSPPSRAWIAGAVLGPVAFFALLGLGVFFFLRRRRRRQDSEESDGCRWMGASSQEDLGFYYNQSMKIDPRASRGPWSPYSSGYDSLRRGNEEGKDDGEVGRYELAGDRSTQVHIELPTIQPPPPVELPATSMNKEERWH
ncbi:hypothetical protein NLG97_g4765 [Lecanicillium saksenae]|uniref:Uncharacterized protein n=1 Tax=Lecanicillium saksenae TaxID=468837 RepID=A0ACC1QW30_9HYPO|nr:hypothetical protein NLG97_g4765 [Lecanicillium saksenae]